jgi:hypothetical protein
MRWLPVDTAGSGVPTETPTSAEFLNIELEIQYRTPATVGNLASRAHSRAHAPSARSQSDAPARIRCGALAPRALER